MSERLNPEELELLLDSFAINLEIVVRQNCARTFQCVLKQIILSPLDDLTGDDGQVMVVAECESICPIEDDEFKRYEIEAFQRTVTILGFEDRADGEPI